MANNPDFQTVFNEFRPKIARYLARLAGHEESEDLCQEVFCKVNQRLPSFKGEAKLSTWLYRIATNAAVDHFRKKKAVCARFVEACAEENWDADMVTFPSEAYHSLQHGFEQREMNACIRQLFDTLPEKYRTILLLSEIEGFTNKEISEIVGLNLGTVKIRLLRGKEHLRSKVNNQCTLSFNRSNEIVCERKESFLSK